MASTILLATILLTASPTGSGLAETTDQPETLIAEGVPAGDKHQQKVCRRKGTCRQQEEAESSNADEATGQTSGPIERILCRREDDQAEAGHLQKSGLFQRFTRNGSHRTLGESIRRARSTNETLENDAGHGIRNRRKEAGREDGRRGQRFKLLDKWRSREAAAEDQSDDSGAEASGSSSWPGRKAGDSSEPRVTPGTESASAAAFVFKP